MQRVENEKTKKDLEKKISSKFCVPHLLGWHAGGLLPGGWLEPNELALVHTIRFLLSACVCMNVSCCSAFDCDRLKKIGARL